MRNGKHSKKESDELTLSLGDELSLDEDLSLDLSEDEESELSSDYTEEEEPELSLGSSGDNESEVLEELTLEDLSLNEKLVEEQRLDELTLDINIPTEQEANHISDSLAFYLSQDYVDDTEIGFTNDINKDYVGKEVETEREGLDIPPKVSLEKQIEFASSQLEFLKNMMTINVEYSGLEGKELSVSLIRSESHGFLNYKDKACLLNLVVENPDNEEVIRIFRNLRKVTRRELLLLSTFVEQLRSSYNEYLAKNSVLSDLRNSVNRFVLGEYLKDPMESLKIMQSFIGSDKIAYVKSAVKRTYSTAYECGNCDHLNEDQDGFFRVLVGEGKHHRSENLILFPLARVCHMCGFLNILTHTEHKELSTVLSKKFDSILYEWKSSDNKLAQHGNMIQYEFSKYAYPEFKRDLYHIDVETKKVQVVEEEEDFSEIYDWLQETKSQISLIKAATVKNTGGFIFVNGSLEIDTEDHIEALRDLTKVYCNLYGEVYEEIRRHSVNSVLLYLKENPTLINRLNPSYVYKKEALVLQKGYLDTNIPSDLLDEMFRTMDKELNVEYTSILDENGEEIPEKRIEFEGKFREVLTRLEEELTTDKRNYELAVDSLDTLSELYRFIDIRYTAMMDLKEFSHILSNPKVVQWVDKISLLMILNRLSGQIKKYWSTLINGKAKNESVMKQGQSRKTYLELVSKLLQLYTSEYKVQGSDGSPIVMVNNFLSTSFTNTQLFERMYNLKTSFETLDYFTFCKTIVSLDKAFSHSSRVFKLFYNLLDEHMVEAKTFLADIESKTSGNERIDYFLYHYGDQFSKEEIESSLDLVAIFTKPVYTIPRVEGESFSEYVKRLSTLNLDEGNYVVDKDSEKFRKMSCNIPMVYGMFEYFRFVSSVKGEFKTTLLMNDLLFYSYLFGRKFMYKFLGVVPIPVDPDDESRDKLNSFRKSEEIWIEFILQNIVYPNREWNLIVSKSDSLDDDDLAFSIVDSIKEEPDAAMETLKYLGEFGGKVYQHYSS